VGYVGLCYQEAVHDFMLELAAAQHLPQTLVLVQPQSIAVELDVANVRRLGDMPAHDVSTQGEPGALPQLLHGLILLLQFTTRVLMPCHSIQSHPTQKPSRAKSHRKSGIKATDPACP
jgi:hypothetical protein